MKLQFPTIESKLQDAAVRWRFLQLIRRLSTIGILACIAILCLAFAIQLGLIQTISAARFGIVTVVIVSLLWSIQIVKQTLFLSLERQALATKFERANPGLMDRLNTLVFIHERQDRPSLRWFAPRIGIQTTEILNQPRIRNPLSYGLPLFYLVACTLFIVGTVLYHQTYAPWSRLIFAHVPATADAESAQQIPEFALPATNIAEPREPWGDVRITDPATDLRLSRFEQVPLQIEAAANEPLREVRWHLMINGLSEHTNTLPRPTESHYAVYKPVIELDDLELSDWDVVSYYAKADTDQNNSYASDIYFIEIRPLREDLLKLPGGQSGSAYQCLNQLTALIQQQQIVVRQTHLLIQNQTRQPTLVAQDLDKLASAENDLAGATRHLHASLAAELDSDPANQALDTLSNAADSLTQAAGLLRPDSTTDALARERKALAELVAARKLFQEVMVENPGEFTDAEPDEPSPTDPDKLRQIAEFRNEAKAAKDFIEDLQRQQQALAQKTAANRTAAYRDFAPEQNRLQSALQDFRQEHPQLFRNTDAEAKSAEAAMAEAQNDLQQRKYQARSSTENAAQQLQQLSDKLNSQLNKQELADAYELRQMLEQQIQTFAMCENAGGAFPSEQLARNASAAQQTIDQLAAIAQDSSANSAFGEPLRNALTPDKKSQIDGQLNDAQKAAGNLKKKIVAGRARQSLRDVADAFDQSVPELAKANPENDTLKPDASEALSRGMSQLGQLMDQMESGAQAAPSSPENQTQQQGRELAANLLQGLTESGQNENPQSPRLLAALDELARGETPVDLEILKWLANELNKFTWEVTELRQETEPDAEMTNIDPSRLPPAYRNRIEAYFKKLSEK